jgi:putative DNA-invertase from lambdoid prophage Rac
MKVAIYARVSGDSQDADNQIMQLTSWITSRGWETTAIFKESESAWKSGHQRELSRLVENARKRRFGAVIVWALDRLSREGPLAILTLVNRLKQFGIKVISYQESWTEAPGELGEILYALAGWVARMESQRRSERTKAGLERVKAQGKRLGRPIGAKDKRKRKKRTPQIVSFLGS